MWGTIEQLRGILVTLISFQSVKQTVTNLATSVVSGSDQSVEDMKGLEFTVYKQVNVSFRNSWCFQNNKTDIFIQQKKSACSVVPLFTVCQVAQ